jgi:predicted nuclease of predicted toxin-antitoxin system
MRLLADENLPGRLVSALRAGGHDVTWVRTEAPGIGDVAVLAMAMAERRILVTFDKDFGELTTRASVPAACGVILLRLPLTRLAEQVPRVAAMIVSRNDWAGHIAVIEPGQVRLRPLTPIR